MFATIRIQTAEIYFYGGRLCSVLDMTLASKFVIEESKIQSEGEGTEEHPIAGKDTKRKSKHSILVSKATAFIEALASSIDAQADSDSKVVYKCITATARNCPTTAKSAMVKGMQCQNGMHHLGQDGMSASMVSLAMAAGEISSVLAPVMSSTLWHAEHLSTKLFGLHKEHGGAGFPGYDVPMPRTTLKSKVFQKKWLARRILQRAHVRIAANLVESAHKFDWQILSGRTAQSSDRCAANSVSFDSDDFAGKKWISPQMAML